MKKSVQGCGFVERWRFGLLSVVLINAMSNTQAADSMFSEIVWHGLIDLSFMHPEGETSWLKNEMGKLSISNGLSGSNLFNLNQAALVMKVPFDWSWSGSITAKYSDRQDQAIDLSEVLLMFHPVSTSHWRFSGRLGAFFPPVSLENSGLAWTSPYTLSSSVINSWVGEELKVFGGELQSNYDFNNGDRVTVFASGFGNNDTAGLLLAWRGWSLDNFTGTLHDNFTVPVSRLSSLFPLQSLQTQPFVEVDGQPGFYTGFSLERPNIIRLRAMYYDNRAIPGIVKNGQYAWHTRFASMGLKMTLPWEIELINQGMLGETQMGALVNNQYAVDTSFWSESLLLSKKIGQHRISVRYEHFAATENDYFPQDPNKENGQTLTCNYNFTWAEHHQINLEMNYIESKRSSWQNLGRLDSQNDTLWQVAYRLFF